jgi:transposase
VFRFHGVDADGKVILRRQLRRSQVLEFCANLPTCQIGMEACAGAHYWARELTIQGYEVRLMAPSYVKPYVKRGKTDAADAEAICEAVTRPSILTRQAMRSITERAVCPDQDGGAASRSDGAPHAGLSGPPIDPDR